jgi:hypothetical protein
MVTFRNPPPIPLLFIVLLCHDIHHAGQQSALRLHLKAFPVALACTFY